MTRLPLLALPLLAGLLLPHQAVAQRFQAVLAEAGQSRTIGTVRLDAERRITVLSARPGRAAMLRELAEELNAEDSLPLDAPPPASAPRYADTTIPVGRNDPRFLSALRLHLRRYYDITLR